MDVNTAPSVHISSFFFKSAVDRRPTRSNQIPTDSFKSAFHLQLVKLNRLTSFAVTHLMQSYIKTAYHSRDTSAHSAHLILQHQHQLQLHTKSFTFPAPDRSQDHSQDHSHFQHTRISFLFFKEEEESCKLCQLILDKRTVVISERGCGT